MTDLCADSRLLKRGDIFIAVPGATVDGRDFIDLALQQGASLVLAEAPYANANGAPIITIPELSNNLGYIASEFYANPSTKLKLIGVTGTNGKTSITSYISQIAHDLGAQAQAIGTLSGALTTLPAIPLQQKLNTLVKQHYQYIALEVSSHALDQQRVQGCTFHSAIFSNLTHDHLDYHHDMESYFQAKARLFHDYPAKHHIINIDDSYGARLYAELTTTKWAYSLANYQHIEFKPQGISARLVTPFGEGALELPLLGSFNLLNVLAAIYLFCLDGYKLEQVLASCSKLKPATGRMQVVATKPYVVIDYAHTPDALEQALLTLKQHGAPYITVVFGCGGDRDKAKRPLMGAIAYQLANKVFITNDNPRGEAPLSIATDIMAKLQESPTFKIVLDRQQAINLAIKEAHIDEVILIAGKGHEDYQIIQGVKTYFSDFTAVNLALQELYVKS